LFLLMKVSTSSTRPLPMKTAHVFGPMPVSNLTHAPEDHIKSSHRCPSRINRRIMLRKSPKNSIPKPELRPVTPRITEPNLELPVYQGENQARSKLSLRDDSIEREIWPGSVIPQQYSTRGTAIGYHQLINALKYANSTTRRPPYTTTPTNHTGTHESKRADGQKLVLPIA